MQSYCDFFQTLHDETRPTGYLGHGTHYSVLRAMVFHDPLGMPLSEAQYADFAVIWDEDHDLRVMEPIVEIYRRGLLPRFVIFGETRGSFTAILSSQSLPRLVPPFNPVYLRKVDTLPLSLRAANCLNNGNIVYIGDLLQKTEAEMLRTPNFGRKSLNEIKDVLVDMGLHLGIEISGWPPADVEVYSKSSRWHALLGGEINGICQSLADPWTSRVATHESDESSSVIDDESERARLYLKNIEMLWRLGMVNDEDQEEVKLRRVSVAA